MSLGFKEKSATTKPTDEEVNAARERAFAAVIEWLNLARDAGKKMPEIMRELGGMMRT